MVARGGDEGNRCGRLRGKSSSYKISHGDVVYSVGNIVNIVVTLYGDRW